MFSPYKTTAEIHAELNARHEQQRAGEGGDRLVSGWVESENAGSGTGRHFACLTYESGRTERLEGKRWS